MAYDTVTYSNVLDVLLDLVDSIPDKPNGDPFNPILTSYRDYIMLKAALEYIRANKRDFEAFITTKTIPDNHPWIKELGYSKKEIASIESLKFFDKKD